MGCFTISKDFTFEASHRLEGLPAKHQCARHHGHSYTLRIALSGDVLDDVGFLMDFGALAPVKEWVDATLDHRHLNDVLPVNPTSERLAEYVGTTVLPTILDLPDTVYHVEVSVSETAKSWATWTR